MNETHDLLQVHRELMGHLKKLNAVVAGNDNLELPQLKAELEEVRAEVLEHFEFEEDGGYMAMVLSRKPQMKRTVDHLLEEHGQLSQNLEDILDSCNSADSVTQELTEKIHSWMDLLRHHESQENKLVQETFNIDTGTGD